MWLDGEGIHDVGAERAQGSAPWNPALSPGSVTPPHPPRTSPKRATVTSEEVLHRRVPRMGGHCQTRGAGSVIVALLVLLAGGLSSCCGHLSGTTTAPRDPTREAVIAVYPSGDVLGLMTSLNVLRSRGLHPIVGPSALTASLLVPSEEARRAVQVLREWADIVGAISLFPPGGTTISLKRFERIAHGTRELEVSASHAMSADLEPVFLGQVVTFLVQPPDGMDPETVLWSVSWTVWPYVAAGGVRSRAISGELEHSEKGTGREKVRKTKFYVFPDVGVSL